MASTQQRLKLNTAAKGGDINGLYECIREDPDILNNIGNIPFVDTPLHIAATAGRTDFALEMMNLKPSFGMKLNPDGKSPLHLALQNRHFETVKQLISFDKELIRVKGRESYTVLHDVALSNEFDWLAKFLCACPAAIEDRTIRGETALHIAVKNSKSEASEVLLGWMRRTHRRKIQNWTDNKGNTVLHIAVFTSQPQIVKSILDQNYINRNAENFEGLTAINFATKLGESEAKREILDMLFPEFLHATNNNNNRYRCSLGDFLKSGDDVLEGICGWIFRVRSGWSLGDPFLSLVRLVLSVLEVIHGWIARLVRSMKSAIYKSPLIEKLLLVICISVLILNFNTIASTFGLSLPSRVLDNNHNLPISNTTAYNISSSSHTLGLLEVCPVVNFSHTLEPLEVCPVVNFKAPRLVEVIKNWPGPLDIKKKNNTSNGEAVAFGDYFSLLFHNEVAFRIALLITLSLIFGPSVVSLYCLTTMLRISNDYISTSFSAGYITERLPFYALLACVFSFFVRSCWNEMIDLPSRQMKRFQMLQRFFDELN
ncbi:Ankyrin repeat-containing protein BDA1 [Camellia lanceoleosa]|uniref:Ankyrin repeat-containing protein BDA1 n=1 Tax=Camellia lanceoleosa TaxID=1840588 RepID=A0ACC0FJ68_9ERIC|nr:Ankyrin repeat-containing protein BDA1 [Camellia lanceoleosa]